MKIANINASGLNAAVEILFETGASATCWHKSEATGLARNGYSGLHSLDLADGCLVAIVDGDADCWFIGIRCNYHEYIAPMQRLAVGSGPLASCPASIARNIHIYYGGEIPPSLPPAGRRPCQTAPGDV